VECSYWINPGLAEYLRKGTIVEIFGRVEARAWVNKNGDAQANLACNVDTIKLLGNSTGQRAVTMPEVKISVPSDKNDLPF
jgi:single-strand DNA-binding protein